MLFQPRKHDLVHRRRVRTARSHTFYFAPVEQRRKSGLGPVSWLIEAGNVVLPLSSDAPWVDDFIEECAAFPKGAYSDQVDCCTQALSRLQHGWPEQGVIYYYDPVQISPV